jgi:hypothetical protein
MRVSAGRLEQSACRADQGITIRSVSFRPSSKEDMHFRTLLSAMLAALLSLPLPDIARADQDGVTLQSGNTVLRFALLAAVTVLAINRWPGGRTGQRDASMVTEEVATPISEESSGLEEDRPDQARRVFDHITIGPVSFGGRAMHFDPQEDGRGGFNPLDGSDQWHGGAQLRLYPSPYFAIEGSADYRRKDVNGTRTHSYPVQVSALLYPLGTTRLAPYLLGGGGWYYTTVRGPDGFVQSQHRFGLHAGGGLQYFLNTHWSVEGTYRHIWLDREAAGRARVGNNNFQESGHMFTIGINWHF